MLANSVVLVTRSGFGTTSPADAGFGVEMLDKFLHTLEARSDKPAAICFYTEGVEAVTQGSPVLLSLQMLEDDGVRLIACGSCLEYYGLADRVAVGEAGGMNDIVEQIASADKVVTV
jgi:hypothetical protein